MGPCAEKDGVVIEVILPLPLLWTHAQQVCCKVTVTKRQYQLGGTVSLGQ
jgi:hypothetical protein